MFSYPASVANERQAPTANTTALLSNDALKRIARGANSRLQLRIRNAVLEAVRLRVSVALQHDSLADVMPLSRERRLLFVPSQLDVPMPLVGCSGC
jgi:hypothetical protein